jgi:hypothetical protein
MSLGAIGGASSASIRIHAVSGQEYQGWLDKLENLEIEELDIDLPEPLDLPEIPDFEDEIVVVAFGTSFRRSRTRPANG